MLTRYIFVVLAGVFLFLGAQELLRAGGRLTPAGKTWGLIGLIFAAVALWQWIFVMPSYS